MVGKKRPTTDNRGAADERACIKRAVTEMIRGLDLLLLDSKTVGEVRHHLGLVVKFIDSRSKRFKARKGGL